MEFDENKAIDYIKAHVENPDIAKYDDEKVIAYVKKQLAKDKDNAISLDHVAEIVEAETAYENTLDD